MYLFNMKKLIYIPCWLVSWGVLGYGIEITNHIPGAFYNIFGPGCIILTVIIMVKHCGKT